MPWDSRGPWSPVITELSKGQPRGHRGQEPLEPRRTTKLQSGRVGRVELNGCYE